MSDSNNVIEKDKKIDFSYPEGFKEAAMSLDSLPEEAREGILQSLFVNILMN